MTIHVFIGAGPANLHRALKIKKFDPSAKIVIIDDRLRPESKDIDRERSRANIFRFENDEVTAKLIADGVSKEKLKTLIHQREFSVAQGFQHQDNKVFSAKPFSQIQIRDLQVLLIETLFELGDENEPLLVKTNLDVSSNDTIQQQVAAILYQNKEALEIDKIEMPEISVYDEYVLSQAIKIHVATGVLRSDDKQHQMVYPEKVKHYMVDTTEDIRAMPVTPLHGTTTFIITDKLTCDQLKENQRSLDSTQWQPALAEFGWKLVRPPRIRVFYANDILYIGAEIPASMMDMPNRNAYEEAITDYTRTIASLVFPDLDIQSLPVNPHLRSRFPTPRGERGEVIHTTPEQKLEWGDDSLEADITIMHHGDSRYLPHYQTGSGFVTAFLQNELYAEIYSRNNFRALLTWARQKDATVYLGLDEKSLCKTYKKLANNDEKQALEIFQAELFMTFSRDIIEENKKKVGRYFNALHNQELNALSAGLQDLIKIFNKHAGTQYKFYKMEDLKNTNPKLVVIMLLKTDNIGFLREVLPTILNKDFSIVSDSDLLNMRDMHVLDYERNIVADAQESNVFTLAMENLAKSNYKNLTDRVMTIATLFEENKTIHHRAAISFFKGKHSDTIHQYTKELRELCAKHSERPELLKSEVLNKTMIFQSKLQEGNSQRTLVFLQDVVNDAFPEENPINFINLN